MTPEEWVDSICAWGPSGLRSEVIIMVKKVAAQSRLKALLEAADIMEEIRPFQDRMITQGLYDRAQEIRQLVKRSL